MGHGVERFQVFFELGKGILGQRAGAAGGFGELFNLSLRCPCEGSEPFAKDSSQRENRNQNVEPSVTMICRAVYRRYTV